ncbi:hypothetical protein GA0061105_105410 [Rhizobium aethiopicum]|uniref:HAMP domain-containing protein n=1 Tax=Rhizobium aethiopicum TaxID=1138170 RepID=A0A1C3Y389_9HYPH|nr:hypothetical protein GA0061105_105410 [Rhizobium aethiopicum]
MVETTNGPGQGMKYRDREAGEAVTDPDQKARFCAEIAALVPAVICGDLTRRMSDDYADSDFRRSATILNELVAVIHDNLSDFNAAMAALSQGDLQAGMRDKHRGAFGQLQKNFNLALATVRTVLGEQGSDQSRRGRRSSAACSRAPDRMRSLSKSGPPTRILGRFLRRRTISG